MFLIDRVILVGAVLVLFGIVSSKFSARIGLPVLVLFLGLGMLAGSEGIGGIEFENALLAHAIGTVALAGILFDGGLQTPLGAIRAAWKPSAALATLGVLITALITGVAATWILGISLLEGILLGSIVSSTDAAAVFAVLRTAGVQLRERLAATLEIESGSNDPMAIFLTIGLLEVLLGRMELGPDLLRLFVLQMGVGSAVGLTVGWVAVRGINRINLGAAGLYPVLTGATGLLAFGLAASLGGSGFLAIYLAGMVLGNSRIVFQKGTFLFHDGLAWVGQITMFVVLGLLSFPSRLLAVAPEALLVAAVLILVARPLAVVPLLLPFRFSAREITLVSWVGLKGAVPIILAIFPLLLGLPSGPLLFDVVFFVVLISAVTQGWSLALVARKLGLEEEPLPQPPVTLEITSLRDVDADIVEYTVSDETRAAGRRLNQLALPEGSVVAMVARGNSLIPARGTTDVRPGDHVFVVLRPESRGRVDHLFSRVIPESTELPPRLELRLTGATTAPLLLTGCRLYDAADDAPVMVRMEDGRIAAIGPELPTGDARVLDAAGRVLIPGLIDLHVHGAGGADVLDGTLDAMTTLARALARLGTTSFLATTFLHPETGDAHLPAAGDAVGRDLGGARALGLHLEGPFINPKRRGGIPEGALRPPSPGAFERLVERTEGRLRMMTIAPELEGAMALLPALEANGVVASFGHSDASYEEARAAFRAGIRHVTHLYNAMPPLHHRESGPLPAIFEDPAVVVQLIVDGAHVAPPVVRWTAATLGAERCACITDGLRASGLPDGRYDYGGRPFETRDGVARYLDGTLVGTTLSLLGVARRLADFARLPFATAVDSASHVPARVLGLEDRKGRIAPGYDADLVLLDPDGEVHATVVAGEVVYRNAP